MLCSVDADLIALEIQCSERLFEVMSEWYKEKMRMLLGFVVEH